MTVGADVPALAEWIAGRRWFQSKSRAIADVSVRAAATLGDAPAVEVLLVDVSFADGGPGDLYQLPLAPSPDGIPVDALADPELARRLLSAMAEDETVGGVAFHHVAALPVDAPARPMGVEQSNSSIVYGDDTVLKVFRRVEPGVNPELEMLRFLDGHGFAAIAPLRGWYDTPDATLGVAQRYLAGSVDGWSFALERLSDDSEALVDELAALGRVTAEMHNALGSDDRDPAFAPEPAPADAPGALAARVGDDLRATLARLPDSSATAPIAGRDDALAAAVADRARDVRGGRLIRTHGDFHLGQTLHRDGEWTLIDFEGEPARPLSERRAKSSPLRDVAGMLRSFAYAAAAPSLLGGDPVPADFEARARAAYLDAYLATVDPGLLPDSDDGVADLLALLETEKVVYELRYELDNRPDWLPIPVAGIARLLETP